MICDLLVNNNRCVTSFNYVFVRQPPSASVLTTEKLRCLIGSLLDFGSIRKNTAIKVLQPISGRRYVVKCFSAAESS